MQYLKILDGNSKLKTKGGKRKMIVKRIISKSRNGNRMEVIAEENNIQKTLHIHQENNVWKYFAGLSQEGKKIFSPINI